MRSPSSSTESSANSCPISWTIFFFGRSSSSIDAMRRSAPAEDSGSPRGCHTMHGAGFFPGNALRAASVSRGRAAMTLPATMTAIAIRAPGGPEMLVPEQRPVPQAGAGEILVKVAAAGVNRPDLMQCRGLYPPPKGAPDILGLEIAGTVAACGEGVTRWKLGDQVAALVIGGGYAEYCIAVEGHALPIPAVLAAKEAAAIPETFFTVWHNVFERGGLKAGETLLVHGGSGGIGTTAIRLAKNFGARVITTAGSAAMSRSTTRARTSSRSPSKQPAARAPTSSSTWWAATISSAITRRLRS